MTTPGKPRQSGIPGRSTGIPTPGRSRSSSSVYQQNPPITPVDDISRAFADAIKANDPSHHRNFAQSSSASTASLSPRSASYTTSSGRRSVAGRPSSVASASSTGVGTVKVSERTKTPTSARTASRPPSRQSEVLSRPNRAFEAGDNVRIESLGFEGTLRYIGEIEGKPGLWAGVELGGGFSGKGKNNGTVGGKQYFSCPDNCGVFVATTKLSAPTVGPGATQRPSSVASSRGGRTTPANSGRMTPSFSATSRTPSATFTNGRITPSTGRKTPSIGNGWATPGTTPAANGRQRTLKTPTAKSNGVSLTDKITAGSRASKYMSMTAQQLNSRDRDTGAESPTRRYGENVTSVGPSPIISRTTSSPTRPPGSPFATPKAGFTSRLTSIGSSSPSMPSGRGRVAINTPRARIPSGIAMPPPPSPKPISLFQTSGAEEHSFAASLAKATQDKLPATASSLSRPGSSASFRSAGTDEVSLLEQLQSRLEAVEYENERLRAAPENDAGDLSAQLEQSKLERLEAVEQSVQLQERVTSLEENLRTQVEQVGVLQSEKEALELDVNVAKLEVQKVLTGRQQDSEAFAIRIESLQASIDERDRLERQKDETITLNGTVIEQLTLDLVKAYTELEEEKKELGGQIDELRIAGQETIALYEERLSASNSQRYELEDRLSSLETRLRSMTSGERSQDSISQVTSSATQIDNESLQEQVRYLSEKSAMLEEKLEDARAALAKDERSYTSRIEQLQHDDKQRKRELGTKTKEVEQLMKSEAFARNRVEEIEEALRESTVALETARGEVEVLRAELTNLDILVGDSSEGDISSRIVGFTKRATADRSRHEQEISRLEDLLRESHAEGNNRGSIDTLVALQQAVDTLKAQNSSLREQTVRSEKRLSELAQQLEDRTSEVEALRKKSNRDVPFSNGPQEKLTSPKFDSSTAREEVAGLKHIVQELQKENLAATQQIKLLESENTLLSSEAEQLRQEVHLLEENLDNSLREEGSDGPIADLDESNGLQRKAKEQNVRLENELEQMRKRITELEMKHARAIHDLNKELSELEALVESKIYREDELEQEVERLKDKLARYKKTSKSSHEVLDGRHRLSSASTSTTSTESFVGARSEDVCEICERPGHDIFSCSMLKDDIGMNSRQVDKTSVEVFCEDCENPGHVAADCPHSLDVF